MEDMEKRSISQNKAVTVITGIQMYNGISAMYIHRWISNIPLIIDTCDYSYKFIPCPDQRKQTDTISARGIYKKDYLRYNMTRNISLILSFSVQSFLFP